MQLEYCAAKFTQLELLDSVKLRYDYSTTVLLHFPFSTRVLKCCRQILDCLPETAPSTKTLLSSRPLNHPCTLLTYPSVFPHPMLFVARIYHSIMLSLRRRPSDVRIRLLRSKLGRRIAYTYESWFLTC